MYTQAWAKSLAPILMSLVTIEIVSNRIMFALVGFCGILFVLTMGLWAFSIRSTGFHEIQCPGAALAIGWGDGSLRIGALDRDDMVLPRWLWSRPRRLSIDRVGPGLGFATNIW